MLATLRAKDKEYETTGENRALWYSEPLTNYSRDTRTVCWYTVGINVRVSLPYRI